MSRTRIAPALTAIVYRGSDIPIDVRAERELRAVLAVISAARGIDRVDLGGGNLDVPTDYWGVFQQNRRALARLDRLSSPSKPRKVKR